MMTSLMMTAMVMTIPDVDTSFKSYMDYRCITNTESTQYKLQKKAVTDENGLRKYNQYYLVAMGSYYGCVGDVFRITFEDGGVIDVMIGDSKADCDTDETNRYYPMGDSKGNVIEFIVDVHELPKTARLMGDISYISDDFSGGVVSVKGVPD